MPESDDNPNPIIGKSQASAFERNLSGSSAPASLKVSTADRTSWR